MAVFGNHYVEDAPFFREKSKERLFHVKFPSDLESDKLELSIWLMLLWESLKHKEFQYVSQGMWSDGSQRLQLCHTMYAINGDTFIYHILLILHKKVGCLSFVLKIFGTFHFSINYFLWSISALYRLCITKYTYQPKRFHFAIHWFSVSPKTNNNRPEKKRKYATEDFVILRQNKVHILFYS